MPRYAVDTFILFGAACVLFFALLLSGPGWGREALLQLSVIDHSAAIREPVGFRMIFLPVISLIGSSAPALIMSVVSALSAALTAAIIFFFSIKVSASRLGAVVAALSLIFAHAFLINSGRPNIEMLGLPFYIGGLCLAFAAALTGSRDFTVGAVLSAALAAVTVHVYVLPVAGVALAVFVWQRYRSHRASLAVVLGSVLITAILSPHGFRMVTEKGGLLLFEFPVVGWFFGFLGSRMLYRRAPLLFWMVLTSIASTLPAYGEPLTHLFASLLPAFVVVPILLAWGVASLESSKPTAERKPVFPAVVVMLTVLFPLLTTFSFLYTARLTTIEVTLADREDLHFVVTPARDELFHAFWPARSATGSAGFLAGLAELPGDRNVLVGDPRILPAVRFAQKADGSHGNWKLVATQPRSKQFSLAFGERDESEIYLAGIDPAEYDATAFMDSGLVTKVGPVFHWQPGVRP